MCCFHWLYYPISNSCCDQHWLAAVEMEGTPSGGGEKEVCTSLGSFYQLVRNRTTTGGLMNNSGYVALTDDWAWLRCIWPIFYFHKHTVTSCNSFENPCVHALSSILHIVPTGVLTWVASTHEWENICIYLLMILSDNCCVLMNNSCHQLMIQIPHLSSPLAPSWQ